MPELKYVPREKNVGQLRNYVFNKNTPLILEVEPGEKFVAETVLFLPILPPTRTNTNSNYL